MTVKKLLFLVSTAARIGFERTEYVVDEGDGSVTVVVRVLDGTLSGDVEVEFNTIDGSATTLGNFLLAN